MPGVFGASGRYLQDATNPGGLTDRTLMCWFRRNGDTSSYSYIMGIEPTYPGSHWVLIGNASVITNNYLELSTSSSDPNFTITPGLNEWIHIAFTVDSSRNVIGYAAAFDDAEHETVSVNAITSFTVATETYGNDSYDEDYPCDIIAIKSWDRVLTAEEIAIERWFLAPVFPNSLRRFVPLIDGTEHGDLSGNGYDLTEGGTVANIDGTPPILWAPGVLDIPQVVAGSGLSLAGAVSTVTATAQTGALAPGAASMGGAQASVTATAQTGTLLLDTQFLTGSSAQVTVTAQTGAQSPGSVALVAASAVVNATGLAGDLVTGAGMAGSQASVTASAQAGALAAGSIAMSGATVTVTVTAQAGAFSAGAAPMSGATAAVMVTGSTGAFSAGAIGTAGSLALSGVGI